MLFSQCATTAAHAPSTTHLFLSIIHLSLLPPSLPLSPSYGVNEILAQLLRCTKSFLGIVAVRSKINIQKVKTISLTEWKETQSAMVMLSHLNLYFL